MLSCRTFRHLQITTNQNQCFHSKMCVSGQFVGIFLLHMNAPVVWSLIAPPLYSLRSWGHGVHIPYSIFPPLLLIKVNERVVVPMNFTRNMQPRPDETHRNNSALFFFQLGMTLLWLITFLLVQKLDRRHLSADIRFTYLSNSDLWNREMKQHKCKAISQPDLQRYEMH